MKNNLMVTIAVAVLAGGIGFFAGMKYQQSRRSSFFRQFGSGQGVRGGQGQLRGGFRPVQGEIISADEKSITVKLTDGSSKIIILSENTQINKAEKVDKEELKVGEKVAVFGQENSDGSVTAQNIQLNPEFRRNISQ
ncbi:MAG: DUF5666 domain-containing protein [Microgenomates group bacterium]